MPTMKTLILLLLLPLTSFAKFGKPELLARLNDRGAWNAPDNMWCFTSEPAILAGKVYLGCMDEKGRSMVQWTNGFKIIARAEGEHLFSNPVASFGKVTWYEYNEFNAQKSFELKETLKVTDIRNLGPLSMAGDNLLPYSSDAWIFRLKSDSPELWIWKKDEVIPFFNPGAAFIYTPYIGGDGSIVIKTRDGNYNETSPDRLWHYAKGSWKVILEDTDANPGSPWKNIRHQMSVDGDKVVALATDAKSEALLLIEKGVVKIIARAGKDVARFDYFAPKMQAGVIAIRGEDFEGRKVLYVHDKDGFRRLLTQGDIVHTDIGLGRVHYSNQDAIFYGAPGVDEKGNVYQQATLTDADHPRTLLGIGLVKFLKE